MLIIPLFLFLLLIVVPWLQWHRRTESRSKLRGPLVRRGWLACSNTTNMQSGKAIMGNLLDIPPCHSWLKFKEWADVYGPIYKLKIANDLLREKGSLYSSREHLPFASALLSNNPLPPFLPYND